MNIEYDPKKDIININKHKISLIEAEKINWNTALTWEDIRYDYGELRFISLAPIDTALYYIVYTERDDILRIISLRKATRKEVKRYVSEV